MSTPHISAEKGDFAKTVLMPGDPLRAKFIADTFLKDVRQVTGVRGMLGFTGTYEGRPISVMGSGMGMPSIGIYSYELFQYYGVERIIRIGSAGAVSDQLHLRDIVLGMGTCTNSNFAGQYHLPGTFAPIADFGLLEAAAAQARSSRIPFWVGNVFSSDVFYEDRKGEKGEWEKMGVLAQEMETLSLYCTAARTGKRALAMLTVGSSIHHDRALSNEEREKKLDAMIRCALEIAG